MDIIERASAGAGLTETKRALEPLGTRRLERPGGADATGEPVVELVTGAEEEIGSARAEGAPMRVVGPGRMERGYVERIRFLEEEAEVRARSLDTAALVERGSMHLLDRMERQLDSEEEALERERAASRRVCVMLGALQRDNEVLREELESAKGQLARLEAPRKRTLVQRLLGRS